MSTEIITAFGTVLVHVLLTHQLSYSCVCCILKATPSIYTHVHVVQYIDTW